VLLHRALGHPCEPLPRDEVFRRFKFRRKQEGRIGMMRWWWDWGYYREAAEAARLGPPVMVPAVPMPDVSASYSTPAGA
jgi:hypothetical protein